MKRSDAIVEDIDALEARRQREHGRRRYSLRDLFRRADPDEQPFRHLLPFLKRHRGALFAALGMSAVAAAAGLAQVFIFKRVLQPIFATPGDRSELAGALQMAHRALDLPLEGVLAGAMRWLYALRELVISSWARFEPRQQLEAAAWATVAVIVVAEINKYMQKLLMRTVTIEIVSEVRLSLFDRLMSFSMRFFQANHSGRLMSRLTSDLTGIGTLLVDVMVDMSTDLLSLVGLLVYLYLEGGPLVLLGLLLAVLSFVPVQQISRRLRRRETSNQSVMAQLFINLTEVLSAQKIVKAFRAESWERERFRVVNEAYNAGTRKSADLRARVQPVVEIIGTAGAALLMYWGGLQVIEGNWETDSFFAVILLLYKSIASMRRLADTNSKLASGLASADRVATLMRAEPEIVDAPDAVELPAFRQAVEYAGVSYGHDKELPVLHDISFTLRKGQTVALVGPTGSGKTTLADLLMRFYDVDAGALRFDGVDLRRAQTASLREQIAIVTQDTVLFGGTIAANIAYARPGTPPEAIERAARAAHAHEFIERLPKGYETEVGERGLRLSGGERQRIAIARALLKDAPILILDEATSALDSASESLVQEAISNLKAGRTTLVIAHRLSTVRDADLILVLERGRIVEHGTHAELLRRGGLYSQLVTLQAG